MNFDEILGRIGEFGAYQRCLFYFLCVPPIFCGLQTMSYVFTSAIPKHRCYVPDCDTPHSKYQESWLNFTIPENKGLPSECLIYSSLAEEDFLMKHYDPDKTESHVCASNNFNKNDTVNCNRWVFDDTVFSTTVSTQWQLVCDHQWQVALAETAYMLGITCGSLVFGNVADRYGRKVVLMTSVLLATLTSTIIPLIPYYSVFLIVKFVSATAFQGMYQTIFIMVMEFSSKSKRVFCTVAISCSFAIGETLLAVVAYFIRDWRTLQLAISLPLFLILPYYWVVPESPRWLITTKRFKEAEIIISKMASKNKVTISNSMYRHQFLDDTEERLQSMRSYERENYSFLDLFKTKKMCFLSLNIFLIWIVITLNFYGLSMSLPSLGENEFSTFFLLSIVEVPAYIFCIIILNRIGRRLPLCLCMLIGGLACISTIFVPIAKEYFPVRLTLFLIGKFCSGASFSIIYVFTAELFPTVIRNIGVGTSSMLAHLSGAIAPYVAAEGEYNKSLPLIIYGLSSIIAGLVALKLPETLGKALPETLSDVANLFSPRSQSCNEEPLYRPDQQNLLLAEDNEEDDISPWMPYNSSAYHSRSPTLRNSQSSSPTNSRNRNF